MNSSRGSSPLFSTSSTDQEVGEHDPADRDHEGNKLVRTLAEHLSEHRRLGKLEADDEENRRERCEWDQVHDGRQRDDTDGKEQAVADCRSLASRTRLNVCRAANDDLRDWETAEQSRDDVAHALRLQFAIGRRHPL